MFWSPNQVSVQESGVNLRETGYKCLRTRYKGLGADDNVQEQDIYFEPDKNNQDADVNVQKTRM
jgi:hypothetical protein